MVAKQKVEKRKLTSLVNFNTKHYREDFALM